MFRDASRDAAIHLKDRLRDMRDFLRAHRHDQRSGRVPESGPREIEAFLGRAVSAVDDTLTLAETVSRTVLPIPPGDGFTIRPLDAYFSPDPTDGENAFRRHMYRTAKALAATLETDAPPVIRETIFAEAHETIRRRHGHGLIALQRSASETLRDDAAVVLAALLQEICRQALAEDPAPPSRRREEAAICCFAPGLVASGLALFDRDLPTADLLEIATLAVAARRNRMAMSLSADQPIATLTAIFTSLLTHLP